MGFKVKAKLLITAYLIFLFSAIGASYFYEKECSKNSTKVDMGITHPIKCKE
jgi:hypothetical protein